MAFPDSFSTARLHAERLRPPHHADILAMHQNAEQMALLGGVRDEGQTVEYMARNLGHWDQYGFGLWMLRNHGQEIIGRVLLRHVMIDGVDEVEVGYSFHPEWWGQGFAPEAASACLRYARETLGLASVVAITLPVNHRSQQVMRRIGMAFDRQIDQGGTPQVVFRTVAPEQP